MGQGIEVTRLDLTSNDLRHEATRSDNGRIACRILAIAQILDGKSREEAATSCGMDRQTLRDWVHRYNARGIEGLRDAPHPGRPSALSADQLEELKALVLAGPDFEKDGVVR
jgi:transposase